MAGKWWQALIVAACSMQAVALAQEAPRNLVLVTLDGLRWQEVFRGVDARLASSEEFNAQGAELQRRYGSGEPRQLLPFIHDVIGSQGVLIGNRDAGSCAAVANPWFFSYPGYNEILTGAVDAAIDTNDAIPNRNVTFLERLNKEVAAYRGQVLAFSSWNAFSAIINAGRSGIPVNTTPLTYAEDEAGRLLARLHDDMPTLWPTVRLDAFTHHYALRALTAAKPRVLYIAYGETDDFAHEGRYDQYVQAAHRTDAFLRELWDTLQSNSFYRDNTVLFVTTDHGRGEDPLDSWQHHASKASLAGYQKSLARYTEGIVGSDAVWMAAIGPGVPAGGPTAPAQCVHSEQIAATLLTLLDIDPARFDVPMATPILEFLGD